MENNSNLTESQSNYLSWFDSNDQNIVIDNDNFYVISYHGKSKFISYNFLIRLTSYFRHPAVWSYNALRESNAQLYEADNRRVTQFSMQAMPNGDAMSAIRKKSVLFTKIV